MVVEFKIKVGKKPKTEAEDLSPVLQPANSPVGFARGRSHVMRSVLSRDN